MATALQCAICSSSYKNPKIIRCGHSFCYQCLQNYVSDKNSFACPICKETIKVTKQGLKGLQNNLSLETFKNTIEDQHHSKCPQHEHYFIDFYCEDCKTEGCSKCILKYHKNHTYIDIDESKEEILEKFENIQCGLQDKMIELKQKYNTLECAIQRLEEHRSNAITSMNTIVETIVNNILQMNENAKSQIQEKFCENKKVIQNRLDQLHSCIERMKSINHLNRYDGDIMKMVSSIAIFDKLTKDESLCMPTSFPHIEYIEIEKNLETSFISDRLDLWKFQTKTLEFRPQDLSVQIVDDRTTQGSLISNTRIYFPQLDDILNSPQKYSCPDVQSQQDTGTSLQDISSDELSCKLNDQTLESTDSKNLDRLANTTKAAPEDATNSVLPHQDEIIIYDTDPSHKSSNNEIYEKNNAGFEEITETINSEMDGKPDIPVNDNGCSPTSKLTTAEIEDKSTKHRSHQNITTKVRDTQTSISDDVKTTSSSVQIQPLNPNVQSFQPGKLRLADTSSEQASNFQSYSTLNSKDTILQCQNVDNDTTKQTAIKSDTRSTFKSSMGMDRSSSVPNLKGSESITSSSTLLSPLRSDPFPAKDTAVHRIHRFNINKIKQKGKRYYSQQKHISHLGVTFSVFAWMCQDSQIAVYIHLQKGDNMRLRRCVVDYEMKLLNEYEKKTVTKNKVNLEFELDQYNGYCVLTHDRFDKSLGYVDENGDFIVAVNIKPRHVIWGESWSAFDKTKQQKH